MIINCCYKSSLTYPDQPQRGYWQGFNFMKIIDDDDDG